MKGREPMAKLKERFIVNERGEKTAAVLPIDTYEQLLEDLHDLAVVAERKKDPVIPFRKVKERLKKDGLL